MDVSTENNPVKRRGAPGITESLAGSRRCGFLIRRWWAVAGGFSIQRAKDKDAPSLRLGNTTLRATRSATVSRNVSPGSRALKPSSRSALAELQYQKYCAISTLTSSTGG